MKALLRYVQKIISSGKDGTINIMIDTGDVGTLTIRKRSIVAATLEDATGKEALEAIKLANIIHMEFWMGIVTKSDIQKMIRIQAETNALSPIPEDEMHPEGAPLVLEEEPEDETAPEDTASQSQMSSEIKHLEDEPAHLTEQDAELLTAALTEYIGPAASILVESFVEKAQDMDHLIELLSEELFSDRDRAEFTNKAYFMLAQKTAE